MEVGLLAVEVAVVELLPRDLPQEALSPNFSKALEEEQEEEVLPHLHHRPLQTANRR